MAGKRDGTTTTLTTTTTTTLEAGSADNDDRWRKLYNDNIDDDDDGDNVFVSSFHDDVSSMFNDVARSVSERFCSSIILN